MPSTKKNDLSNNVYLFDLDDTLTNTSEHVYKDQAGTPHIFDGTIDLIVDIIDRDGKVAIVTHSSHSETIYAQYFLEALSQRGIYVPVISFITLFKEHFSLTVTEADREKITFKVRPNEDQEYRSFLDIDFTVNRNLLPFFWFITKPCIIDYEFIEDNIKYFHNLFIHHIGKGNSSVMGYCAIKSLLINLQQTENMNLFVFGDRDTDILFARNCRALGFQSSYAYLFTNDEYFRNFQLSQVSHERAEQLTAHRQDYIERFKSENLLLAVITDYSKCTIDELGFIVIPSLVTLSTRLLALNTTDEFELVSANSNPITESYEPSSNRTSIDILDDEDLGNLESSTKCLNNELLDSSTTVVEIADEVDSENRTFTKAITSSRLAQSTIELQK